MRGCFASLSMTAWRLVCITYLCNASLSLGDVDDASCGIKLRGLLNLEEALNTLRHKAFGVLLENATVLHHFESGFTSPPRRLLVLNPFLHPNG